MFVVFLQSLKLCIKFSFSASDLTLWVTQSYGVLGILLAIIACLGGCICCDESPAGVASSVFNFGAGNSNFESNFLG